MHLQLSKLDLEDPLPQDQILECFPRDNLPCLLFLRRLLLDHQIRLVPLHHPHSLRDLLLQDLLVHQILHTHRVISMDPHPPIPHQLSLVDLINSLPLIKILAISHKFGLQFQVMEDLHPLLK